MCAHVCMHAGCGDGGLLPQHPEGAAPQGQIRQGEQGVAAFVPKLLIAAYICQPWALKPSTLNPLSPEHHTWYTPGLQKNLYTHQGWRGCCLRQVAH